MIILTGGAGFIGTNILRELNTRGKEDILVVDNIGKTRKWVNLRGCHFRQYINKQDLWEWLDVNSDVDIEAIIHMGACSDTSEKDFDYLIRNNTNYSQKLWDIAVEKQCTFIYASSAATYGDGSLGFSDKLEKADDLIPVNAYGMSKHLFDLWALHQTNQPPQWIGLKYFNVYGPYESHKGDMASVVYHGFNQIQETGKMRLFKSHDANYKHGEQKRDFIFVNDVVKFTLLLMDETAKSGLYNIGTGVARTFDELAKALFRTMEKTVNIEYFDMPSSIRKHYQYFTMADMRKSDKALRGVQVTPLVDGVGEYVNWLIKNNQE